MGPTGPTSSSGFGEKPILSFETRSRIVFFQSRASRRERDFVHRISSLETRSRILFTESRASRRDREFCSPNLEIRDEIEIFRSFYQNILVRKKIFPINAQTLQCNQKRRAVGIPSDKICVWECGVKTSFAFYMPTKVSQEGGDITEFLSFI